MLGTPEDWTDPPRLGDWAAQGACVGTPLRVFFGRPAAQALACFQLCLVQLDYRRYARQIRAYRVRGGQVLRDGREVLEDGSLATGVPERTVHRQKARFGRRDRRWPRSWPESVRVSALGGLQGL